jgi:hypothetical protein
LIRARHASPRSVSAVAVALAVVAVAGASTAHAADGDGVEVRRMRFAERGGQLVVSAGFTDIFDKRAYDKLNNGFPTSIVVRAYVYRKGHTSPVSVAFATLRVVYDLWEEVYVVRIERESGHADYRLRSRADALKRITELTRFPIADLDKIPIGPHHYLGLAIELNPVTSEDLAEMRRWLSRPAGNTSLDRGTSFFGSFVSVFVNPKLPEADRVLRLRSQDFYRVKR